MPNSITPLDLNEILAAPEPSLKIQALRNLYIEFIEEKRFLDLCSTNNSVKQAGFPSHLIWVSPSKLKNRKVGSTAGRCSLMHAVAHIEFNAINLALDAMCRFVDMPDGYYIDWFRVAAEEAYHFELISLYLKQFGYQYGDFPVHDGLWQMAIDTGYDVLARMACVPRLMEARGLDVAPFMAEKLKQSGDILASDILGIIFHDEKSHVQVGNRWFGYLCERRGLDPHECFKNLVLKHAPDYLRGPYHLDARRQAGFSEIDLDWIVNFRG